jgi:hypothetical protein
MSTTIEEILRKNRPNITESSIKTYSTSLRSVYRKAYPEDKDMDLEKFKNHQVFLTALKDVKPSRRKSILAALLVFTNVEQYRELMKADSAAYDDEINQNVKSEKQAKNWVTQAEIKSKLEQMRKMTDGYWKIESKTIDHIQFIQSYVLLCVMSGYYFPPRRSLDFSLMKFRQYDRREVGGTDNFYNGRSFVFNVYKTSKSFERQKIEIPKQLQFILNKKWIPLIPAGVDHLFFDFNLNPLHVLLLRLKLHSV